MYVESIQCYEVHHDAERRCMRLAFWSSCMQALYGQLFHACMHAYTPCTTCKIAYGYHSSIACMMENHAKPCSLGRTPVSVVCLGLLPGWVVTGYELEFMLLVLPALGGPW